MFLSRDNFFYHVIILHPEITFLSCDNFVIPVIFLSRDNFDYYPVIIFYLVIHFCPMAPLVDEYENHSRKRPALVTDTFFASRGRLLKRASTVI